MKVIKEFPNYSISKDGKIYSRLSNKFLKLVIAKNGYGYYSLMKNERHYYKSAHRLILETFRGPCPTGTEACHNNGVRADSKLSNLRWDTRKANAADSAEHGTKIFGERRHNAKLTEADVRYIFYLYYTKHYTQVSIAKAYDISTSHINGILHKRYWKHLW